MDGSNAWQESHPDDEPGMWESKEPISYPVIDRFGQVFTVWRFPKAGGMIVTHTHKYDHCSILEQGSVVVTGDDERGESILVAPDVMFFKAGTEHSIRALTDKTMLTHTYPPGFSPEDAR